MNTTQYPTWIKISKSILPLTIETVLSLNPHKPACDKFSLYTFSKNDMLQDFKDMLEVANLDIKYMQIFYRPGYGKEMNAFIHTDGHIIIPDLAKINYIFSPPGNIMNWWLPIVNITERNKYSTRIGSNFLKFESKECKLIDQKELIGLYVVNAGIPHSVDMTNASVNYPRICVSITPMVKNSSIQNSKCQDVANRLEYAIKELKLNINHDETIL